MHVEHQIHNFVYLATKIIFFFIKAQRASGDSIKNEKTSLLNMT